MVVIARELGYICPLWSITVNDTLGVQTPVSQLASVPGWMKQAPEWSVGHPNNTGVLR